MDNNSEGVEAFEFNMYDHVEWSSHVELDNYIDWTEEDEEGEEEP